MSPTPVMQGAEPYFHRGGDVGCLVLHGFTASPAEVRWLAAHLAAQGHTVYAPRLAGHGTTPEDLARTRWRDWYGSALDGYHMLRASCRVVVVVGHSMGGLLALLLASDVAVDGVAVLAAPMRLSRTARLSRWFAPFARYSDQSDRTDLPEQIRKQQAALGEPVLGRVRYDRWPTRSVVELVRLTELVCERLPQVNAPLLLVYSERDPVALVQHAEWIAADVASEDIERHTLTECAHILPQDSERETVFALTAAFVARLA